MLSELVPQNIDASSKYPKELHEDLLAHWAARQPETDVAIKCKYLYFATSMVHVFPRTLTAVAYVTPNRPLPYVWFHVVSAETSVGLLGCHGITTNRVRVLLHVVRSPKEFDTVKRCFDPTTKEGMPYSQGNAIQLVLRLDDGRCEVVFKRPDPTLDCVVMVSLDGRFKGAYHVTEERLIVGVH